MKRLRKFLTLMLALCMVLAMSVTVMAADEDGVTSTFTNQGVDAQEPEPEPTPEPEQADKTELGKETEEAESLGESKYTPERWEALEEALDYAKEVLKDPDATQEDIDNGSVINEVELKSGTSSGPDDPDILPYVSGTDEQPTEEEFCQRI